MFQTDVDVVASSEPHSHSPPTSFPCPLISVSSVSCLLNGADNPNSSLPNSNINSSGSNSPLDAHSDSNDDIPSFAPWLLGPLNSLDDASTSHNQDVESASSMYDYDYDYDYYYYHQDTLHYRPRRSSKHYSPSSIQSPSPGSSLGGKLRHLHLHLHLYDHSTPIPIPIPAPASTPTFSAAISMTAATVASSSSSKNASSIYPYSFVMEDRPSIVLSTPIQSSILKRRRSITRTGTRKARMSRRRKIASTHHVLLPTTCSNAGIDHRHDGLLA